MVDCIVVAAGPSAPQSYDWIRESDMPVVCVSTMLAPLQRVGIHAMVTCIRDPSPIMVLHFKGADTSELLVHAAGVQQNIVDEWYGSTLLRRIPIPGSSVVHMAVQSAILDCNATTVHIVGADFAYPDGQSHALGVITNYAVDRRACVKELNGHGNEVLTDRDLLHYRGELEQYIAANPGVRFIRHGRDGLPVRGAEWADDGPVRA